MSEWQSIETAPKDGTWILLAFLGAHHAGARSRVAYGMWSAQGSEWVGHFEGTAMMRLVPASHWMPLPAPPSS